MDELRPFDLVPVDDGCYELRAFSDDSEDPISITLDPGSGRRLAAAIGEALLYAKGDHSLPRQLEIAVGSRLIAVIAVPGNGVRIVVTR